MQLLTAGPREVAELAFAPASDALVAACRLTMPLLWSLPAGEPIKVPVPGYYAHSDAFTFSADGNVLGWISHGDRNEYDRAAGTSRVVELTPPGEQVLSQAISGPDGRLVTRSPRGGAGGRYRAFAADGRGRWAELWSHAPGAGGFGCALAASPRADRFFALEMAWFDSGPRRLLTRSALTGEEVAAVEAPDRDVGLTAHPDGAAVVAFSGSWLWVWASGDARPEKVRTGVRTHYNALAYHPDGRHLLAGNNDATARLIDTRTWQVVRQYAWEIGKLTAVAVSPDGALAAAGGEDGRVVVWDLDV